MPSAASARSSARSRKPSSRRQSFDAAGPAPASHALRRCNARARRVLSRARSRRLRALPASLRSRRFAGSEHESGTGTSVIIRKSASEIEQMERAAQVVAETLQLVADHVVPGITTEELDELAEEFIRSRGGVPTFKGYRGYPSSICTSPNSMVVHGIPGAYTLRDGDVLSVDVGVTLGG